MQNNKKKVTHHCRIRGIFLLYQENIKAGEPYTERTCYEQNWCLEESLHFRGPHFTSKVSYNAGAVTDDCTGQCNSLPQGHCRQPLILLF